jgi:RNA exonuclease 4
MNWLALKANGLKGVESAKTNLKRKEPTPFKRKAEPNIVGLDCEMVEGVSIEHMLARVSLVDYDGRIVYDAYVKPVEQVIDYRTSITGLTQETLSRRGESFKDVKVRVEEILKNKLVVGHAIHHDFEALGMLRPEEHLIRDTCLYPPLRPPKRKSTPSLRLLAEYWLGKVVQTGSHSSVEDARTAMSLYKRFRSEWDLLIESQK